MFASFKEDRYILKRYGAFLLVAAVLLLALTVGLVSNLRDLGDDPDVFGHANFTDVRQPLHPVNSTTPHGQISLSYIEHMNDNYYDRFSYTVTEMQTAKWLVDELLAIGYTWNDIEIQEFSLGEAGAMLDMDFVMDLFLFFDSTPFANFGFRPSEQSQNVILRIPGRSAETIIVGAHYDSVYFPGASDNASGTALLLESAIRMQGIDNYYTIEYVFFGAEESGLYGSIFYAEQLSQAEHDNILFMLNADVLLDGDDLFYMAGYDANGRPGANSITEKWDSIALDINAQYGFNLRPLPWGVFGPSDQLAFLPHGHTAMFMAGLDVTGEIPDGDVTMFIYEMNRAMHTPHDDIHFMNDNWPSMGETNMRAFSIFLEEMLLADYSHAG